MAHLRAKRRLEDQIQAKREILSHLEILTVNTPVAQQPISYSLLLQFIIRVQSPLGAPLTSSLSPLQLIRLLLLLLLLFIDLLLLLLLLLFVSVGGPFILGGWG